MRVLASLFVLSIAAGCGFDDPPVKTVHQRVERAGAKAVTLEVRMIGGGVKIAGGVTDPSDLLAADLAFNRAPFEPQSEHSVDAAGAAKISLHHAVEGGFLGRSRNEWDVHLASDVPATLDVAIDVAGAATLDLANLAVAGVTARVGTGMLEVDLSKNAPHSSITMSCEVGTGELHVKLPSGFAIRLRGHDQVGDVQVHGVPQVKGEKTVWQTADFDSAAVKIDVGFRVGVGQSVIDVVNN